MVAPALQEVLKLISEIGDLKAENEQLKAELEATKLENKLLENRLGTERTSPTQTQTQTQKIIVERQKETEEIEVRRGEEGTSSVKPKSLKEAIIRVLQEAGPGGLTVRQIAQRIKKKNWWDWKNEKSGYDSVSESCRTPRNRDVFVRVAPGFWALWELQDDDFTPYKKPVKPKTLKEAIILVLQEAGPGGLTVRQIVQRIMADKLWDWENEQSGLRSVAEACRRSPDVFFQHHLSFNYALRSLQGAEGSSKPLAKEKADVDAERTTVVTTPVVESNPAPRPTPIFNLGTVQSNDPSTSGVKRMREAADGSGGESNQVTRKEPEIVEEPQSDVVLVDERRRLLYTDEKEEAANTFFDLARARARARANQASGEWPAE